MKGSKIKIHLYTTFYNDFNPIRKQEYKDCLLRNASNPYIDTLTVLNEGDSIGSWSSKIKELCWPQRPTYNDFIGLINQSNTDGDIHIVANTDIYFPESIVVLKDLPLQATCLALSRWDVSNAGTSKLYYHNDSQDVWIFQGRIKSGISAPFPLGVPRCDNKFMYLLQEAGYKVLNPSFSIPCYHLHSGARVAYREKDNLYAISPPYAYRFPHHFFGLFRTLWFNLTHKERLAPYRYDWHKAKYWIPFRLFNRIFR